MQSGSPIFLYSGSLETQYWRGFARVGCAKLKMFALLDCSELPLRPEPGRPWTTSPSPWTAGTACGCTLAAHRLGRVAHRRPTTGGTPPEPPAALRTAHLLNFSRSPKTARGWASSVDNRKRLTTPATGRTRARNPSGWVTEAAGARCAKARQGAQPWGSGGASPLPRSALGAGRRPGGLSLFGPLGGA